MSKTIDKYTTAAIFFIKYPSQIKEAWNDPDGHEYGYLFAFLTPSGTKEFPDAGCVTQVRGGTRFAYGPNGKIDEEFSREIRENNKLPDNSRGINPHNLSKFVKVQRKADERLRGGSNKKGRHASDK